jgi:hypothetical protein
MKYNTSGGYHVSFLWTNRVGKIYNQEYEIYVKFRRINSQKELQMNWNGIRDVYFYALCYENMMPTLLQADVK